MLFFLLFLLCLSINTAAVVADPMLVKRQCVGGCYPTDEQNCATKSDAQYYKEFPVNTCIEAVMTRAGYVKYQCDGDTYKEFVYEDEHCTQLRGEAEDSENAGCHTGDSESAMRVKLLQELPNNMLEIELCSVGESSCDTKYQISTEAAECTSFNDGRYFMTWGSKGELILYGEESLCQAKTLFRAFMIAPNIKNKKSVVYSPSNFITCNDLPVAVPPKKLEIFKCADSACGDCAAKDSDAYESYTSGECLYDSASKTYSKYECTKGGMLKTQYNQQSGGCTPSFSTTTSRDYYGGCSRPSVVRGRSYGPLSDGSGVNVELCIDICANYTLAKETTTCATVRSTNSYTWKGDTLIIYSSTDACTAKNKFERIFVATGFDKPTSTVVYEKSVRVLCGGEGENPLPERTPQLPLEIAACGDGNPTDIVDTCGVHKEGQCANGTDSNGVFRSMTTRKCFWDDKQEHYYMSVCNSTTYGVYNFGRHSCEGTVVGVVSIEWGETGCAKISRRARYVEARSNNQALVEYCIDAKNCSEFILTKGSSSCSPMGNSREESTLPKGMYYTWDGTLIIYNTKEDCTSDSPSRLFTRAFVGVDFTDGSNITYNPYQYVTCDGKPIVELTTTTTASSTKGSEAPDSDDDGNNNHNSSNETNNTTMNTGLQGSGCLGYTQTQMVLMVVLLLFIFSI